MERSDLALMGDNKCGLSHSHICTMRKLFPLKRFPVSRLTIDVTEQQHQALKAMAALEGKSIKQFALERLFQNAGQEQEALQSLKALLAERIAEAERGGLEEGSITSVADEVLGRRA